MLHTETIDGVKITTKLTFDKGLKVETISFEASDEKCHTSFFIGLETKFPAPKLRTIMAYYLYVYEGDMPPHFEEKDGCIHPQEFYHRSDFVDIAHPQVHIFELFN